MGFSCPRNNIAGHCSLLIYSHNQALCINKEVKYFNSLLIQKNSVLLIKSMMIDSLLSINDYGKSESSTSNTLKISFLMQLNPWPLNQPKSPLIKAINLKLLLMGNF